MPFLSWVGRGYDRKSLLVLVALVSGGLALGRGWTDLFPGDGSLDILLTVMWAWLAIALPWRVRPVHDMVILGFGLLGGALIETWGTVTGVWWYFTSERPPWWVIPAWATTALAGERVVGLVTEIADRILRVAPRLRSARLVPLCYWIVLPVFAIAMTVFSLRATTWGAVAIAACTMVLVIVTTRSAGWDLAAFLAGTLLGAFIEPWGTGHRCWTYYTLETPPLVAVFAHGFATLAFLRAADIAWRLWSWVGSRRRP